MSLFNRIAPVYGWFYNFQKKNYKKILDVLESADDLVDMKQYRNIIDIGCGTGALCSVLNQRGLRVTGVDYARKMLDVAKRKTNGEGIHFLQASVLDRLPFDDNSFEVSIASYVAHGLTSEDRFKMYEEMARISSRLVIIYDYNSNRSLMTDFVEWLEGGDYFNFIKYVQTELSEYFGDVKVLEVDKRAAWYVCSVPNVFDKQVDLYEAWFLKNKFILDSEVEAIRQLLPVAGFGIEIGTGTGIFASRLGISDGLEPSLNMRKVAEKRGINTIEGYAEDMPIDDGVYSNALMVTVDCFLDDVEKSFREVYRILSFDGVFVIAFIDRETPLGRLYDKGKKDDDFYSSAEFHSSDEITTLLMKTGFEIIDRRQTVFDMENKLQEVKRGNGEGVFAVIKARKI